MSQLPAGNVTMDRVYKSIALVNGKVDEYVKQWLHYQFLWDMQSSARVRRSYSFNSYHEKSIKLWKENSKTLVSSNSAQQFTRRWGLTLQHGKQCWLMCENGDKRSTLPNFYSKRGRLRLSLERDSPRYPSNTTPGTRNSSKYFVWNFVNRSTQKRD